MISNTQLSGHDFQSHVKFTHKTKTSGEAIFECIIMLNAWGNPTSIKRANILLLVHRRAIKEETIALKL